MNTKLDNSKVDGTKLDNSKVSNSKVGVENNTPLLAERIPFTRKIHGRTYVDHYAWMKNRDSLQLRDYVQSQNAYTTQRMKPLESLRSTLFNELKSRVQETDMSVPMRMNGYWYYVRTEEGKQYPVQCRMRVIDDADWNPPTIDSTAKPGETLGEEILFDANAEAERLGANFLHIGGMDISRDGARMLYGVDTQGDERLSYYIRDYQDASQDDSQSDSKSVSQDVSQSVSRTSSHWVEREESWHDLASASLTPDGQWVFYVRLDDAWRPYQVWRHRVGTSVDSDVMVFEESDERFFVDVYESFDERYMMINSSSKTTSRVLMLPLSTPEGQFRMVIEPKEGVEYDISFACFEHAGTQGEDIPVAVVSHNAKNPNFEIDIIDMRDRVWNVDAPQPYVLGSGVCVAAGSPYGCAEGDAVELEASSKPITQPYSNPQNPEILQNEVGLSISGLSIYEHYVALSYRAQGLPRIAVMSKDMAAQDFLAGRPWRFRQVRPEEVVQHDVAHVDMLRIEKPASVSESASASVSAPARARVSLADITPDEINHNRLFSIAMTGNPSYEAPRMRYAFGSYATLGQLRELDPATGEDRLLKRGTILGEFDERKYAEKRIWISARDGERVPVSLVWRPDAVAQSNAQPNAMFITAYGAYEVSSDPAFSVGRLSLLDRGVLYAQVHVRGGGEMGRAWYEQGRRGHKKHTFEDFVDATRALQRAGYASAEHTVANGGSAGGLLMGAVANMAPECYAGIEADVPFVDALTSMLDASLPLTVTEWDEWGNPLHSVEDYDYMKSYTPYENVPDRLNVEGCAALEYFPKIFITSSLQDTRVLVTEPLKWLAQLQYAGVDAVARIETDGGHGGTSGRYRQWRELAYENAWCLHVMGIDK